MLHQRLQPSSHTQPRRTCAGGGPCRLAGANAWVIPSRPLHHPRAQVICSAAKQSLYEVLGVPQTATEREIKSAYRKRALKLHPDVNKAPDAQQQFMEAKMAFQTLGDAKQRAEYDRRLRMGFGSSADWQSRTSSSSSAYGSSSYGSSGARRPYSKPEDNYTFDDLMRDLDKEFSSWANSKPASTGKAKSLLEELEMIGEEFVDFLEGALGTKESDKSSSSSTSGKAEGSSSSKSKAPRNSMEEFDQLWKKYGESSAQSAAAGQGTSSSGAGSSSKNSSTNGASSTSSRGAGSSSNGTGSTSRPGASSEDDIDAMLAALKKKVRKEG